MVTVGSLLAFIDVQNTISESELSTQLNAVVGLDNAAPGSLSFLSSAKYRRSLSATQATAVILTEKDRDHCPEGTIQLVVEDPYLAYAQVSHLFDLRPVAKKSVHPTAVIADDVTIGKNVTIGANAVIEEGVVLADGVEIGALSYIGEFSQIGTNSKVFSRVTIEHRTIIGESCVVQSGVVIGGNGFGYAPSATGWHAIAQVGHVVIGNRVEIGANTTVDRGAISNTVIEDDVIIDNLVQVAHNVVIGKRTAMAGQSGIAGSAHIGSDCTIGGQAGIGGHIRIADNSHFTGQAMVAKGTTEAGLYSSGIPAQKSRDWRKLVARLNLLGTFNDRLKKLEKDHEESK